MVIDYRDRKPVAKNRPKKQPFNFMAVFVVLAVLASYAGGLLTGWFVFRSGKTKIPVPPVQQVAADAAPPVSRQGKPSPNAVPGDAPPLTFYETLSKGSTTALIGSGINPRKVPEVTAPRTAPGLSVPATSPATSGGTSSSTSDATGRTAAASPSGTAVPTKPSAAAKPDGDPKPGGKATYVVQVASFKDRKEAEAAVARLTDRGLAAYISESKVTDKGMWYRVRIGKRLDHQAAADLAGRAGKGAVPVAE